jgi:WD40 repeat protein
VATGTNAATLDTPTEGVEEVLFSPDGKTLAGVSRAAPEVYLWDVASGRRTATYEKRLSRPRPRLFRYVWDAFPQAFEEHALVPLSVFFAPDGRLMALGFDNRDSTTVQMWQVTSSLGPKK